MTISLNEFIEKYQLNNFNEILDLKGREKIDFFQDFKNLIESFCNMYDILTNISSIREGLALLAIAKLSEGHSNLIFKADVKDCLKIDRYDKLTNAFANLEKQDYIKIEKKRKNIHLISLNEKDNQDFKAFREVVQMFWTSPKEENEKNRSWRGE